MSFNLSCSKKVIRRAQKGDKFALTQIYQLYKQPVFNLAYQMLRDEQRANDILQTVMVKMMTGIGSVSDRQKLNGWMKRVTYNTVIDVIRSNSKLVDIPDNESFDYSAADSLSIINSEHWDLERFLSFLDERERLVVWLSTVEGYTHKEIAEQLNISAQNSRVVFSRAMKSLKSLASDHRYSGHKRGKHYE
ncbi:RNA polymerase sigma factor [Kangiella shandongensis]|uniref:RNA polymerase sigma factor n=1 Tax=Kangiella shandongensis TaxID=2763258 RepID=UPI001CBCD57F|nr:sigma-70 family RNA polymerase sigma factor [Kangiella shandongensis]